MNLYEMNFGVTMIDYLLNDMSFFEEIKALVKHLVPTGPKAKKK